MLVTKYMHCTRITALLRIATNHTRKPETHSVALIAGKRSISEASNLISYSKRRVVTMVSIFVNYYTSSSWAIGRNKHQSVYRSIELHVYR